MDSPKHSQDGLIPSGLLPGYLSDAFGEIYGEDGLLVMGKGLGLSMLIAAFVRFYGWPSGETGDLQLKSNPLVFVLGLRDSERETLTALLESWGTPPDKLPIAVTNETGSGKDREVMYQKGGVFCVTSRILIVDLLSNIAKANDIDGVLVAHAENVTEQSTEAFILRICHTQKQLRASGNQSFFVKAFSDAPEVLMSGFSKTEKVLKALYLRRLYLYPRFHSAISGELDRRPPNVDELYQELSPRMQQIQAALAAAVRTCIRELKNSTTLLEWTGNELSVENCVTTRFDLLISRHLEGDWHRLKPQTKQLVQDLRTLRTLFQYLIQYDAVSFWKLINSIKAMSAASRSPSMWLLTPAADLLFRLSKERLYRIVKPRATKSVPDPVSRLEPVLEQNPKSHLLRKVLQEIKQDADGSEGKRAITTLVLVKDGKALESVKANLHMGGDKTLALKWLRYLESCNDKSRSVTRDRGGVASISEESRLLLEEEGRVRRGLFREGSSGTQGGKRNMIDDERQSKRKRRKLQAGRVHNDSTVNLEQREQLEDAVQRADSDVGYKCDVPVSRPLSPEDYAASVAEGRESRVVIKSHTKVDAGEGLLLLQDCQPSHIILYDIDISFIREIEIYSCLLGETTPPPKVHFLILEASAEEKAFLTGLEKEKSAFERLIHYKKTSPMPARVVLGVTQEVQQALAEGSMVSTYANGTLPLAIDTRRGHGKAKQDKARSHIAVDVREFRSSLPSVLHQGGMRLAPVTLTVGDFVLSSVHCVERKSISDLFGSFASGRLYQQAEAMTKYYKCPCLLIEFDPSKSCCLQNQNELGVEIRSDAITSKLSLLTMHFPALRILWSRSAHETLRLFKELKANHEEVDVDRAVDIGRSESVDAFLEEFADEEEEGFNEAAHKLLLQLPGMTVPKARKVMQECENVAELVCMPGQQLKRLLGPVAGQKLLAFFRQKVAAM